MKRKITVLTLCAMLFALSLPSWAQQPRKVYRIGMLRPSSVSTDKDRMDAFREGLRELGYVEGKNIIIEYRYAEGKREMWPKLAAEMVRSRHCRRKHRVHHCILMRFRKPSLG